MNLRFLQLIIKVGVLLGVGCCWVGAEPHSAVTGFRFRRIYLSDSAARIGQLRLPESAPPIAVDNIPLLARKEFGDFLLKYIGREITEGSLSSLAADVTDYVHRHGQSRVEVTLPPQNVAGGEVRVVVVIGRYDLVRLIVSDSEEKASAYRATPQSGQIVVEDEPALATQSFAAAIGSHFGQPITDEQVNNLVDETDRYLRGRGEILAHVSIPRQDVSTGELRLAMNIGRYPLRRIVVGDSESELATLAVAADAPTIFAPGQPMFATPEFRRLVEPYLGRDLSRSSSDALRNEIRAFVQKHDRLVLDIPAPAVNVRTGEMRIAVLVARYGQIRFKGNKWFSDRLLAHEIGVHAGQEVRLSELEAAINRANQSPFRHLQATLNSLDRQPGRSEVGLDVDERDARPLRVATTYDDTGNNLIGNAHYTASLQLGNVWGRDDQMSYQMTTTDSFSRYHVQLATYRAELPWKDYVNLVFADASYRATQPFFSFSGRNYVGDVRYAHPIFGDTWSLEFWAGADYKQIDTRSVYGSSFVLANTVNSVAQLTGGATYVQRDAAGSWVAALTLNGSPGGLNNRNTDARFQGNVAVDPATGQPVGGPEAQAHYFYGTAVVQRLWLLPEDFQVLLRGQLQLSSARLLGTERMSIGGAATVRGYNERVMSGDEGWNFALELHSPAWKTRVPFTHTLAPWENRLITFFDDGRVDLRHPRSDDYPEHRLASFGLGLRSNWAANFSMSLDYGWQLERTGTGFFAQPNRSRGDLQATLSY